MGVTDLFSSPTKQGQQSGQAQQGLAQNEINQMENYVGQSEAQQRAAISGLGQNPYFGGEQKPGQPAGGSPLAKPVPLTAFAPAQVPAPPTAPTLTS